MLTAAFSIAASVAAGGQSDVGGASEIDGIVAVVNDDVIVTSELVEMVKRTQRDMRASNNRPPPTRILEKKVLDRLILERLQLQVAARLSIKIADEDLNKAISAIAKRNRLGLPEFRKILERDGVRFTDFRERIRKEMMVSRVQQRKVRSRVRVRETELDRHIELKKTKGDPLNRYRLAHILIGLPPEPSTSQIEAKRTLAVDIVGRTRLGAEFAMLARKFSDGQQAKNGGDLGWRTNNRLPSLFAPIVPKLAKGEVSDPIRSPSGFHIVRVTDLQTAQPQSLIRQSRPQHILIRTNELVADDDARIRLEQLRERIRQGASFEELARANSDDRGSAVKDGNLGWINPGDLVAKFERVMKKLSIGELSKPFKTTYGWHIVRVIERRDYDGSTELKRTRAREEIHKRRTANELEAWLAQLRDEAYVEYRFEH